MPYKRTFNPTGRRPTIILSMLGPEIDAEWARMQGEKETPEKPCCAKCKTPFGHSAIAGVCCHTRGTR